MDLAGPMSLQTTQGFIVLAILYGIFFSFSSFSFDPWTIAVSWSYFGSI
jgi:hypothetical protein